MHHGAIAATEESCALHFISDDQQNWRKKERSPLSGKRLLLRSTGWLESHEENEKEEVD
jgi:hypothetical protein